MSIEQALASLQAAIEANTAALLKSGGKPAATTTETGDAAPEKKGRGRPAKEDGDEKTTKYKAKYDKSAMTAALNELKEEKGVAAAKEIIKTVGKQDKMADIVDPELIDKVYEAAKAAMDGGDDDEGDM